MCVATQVSLSRFPKLFCEDGVDVREVLASSALAQSFSQAVSIVLEWLHEEGKTFLSTDGWVYALLCLQSTKDEILARSVQMEIKADDFPFWIHVDPFEKLVEQSLALARRMLVEEADESGTEDEGDMSDTY